MTIKFALWAHDRDFAITKFNLFVKFVRLNREKEEVDSL